ncbi:MAG: hypothetical protein JW839_22585 [Candidatus Lokiarchaeota archaeon]|nr:hypothetical protein [Candidatus Lokiarchaeota archaeon]
MVRLQIEAAITRSTIYSVIELFCIICVAFLIYKTSKRFAEKRAKKNAPVGIGAPISIMLQYEIAILVGLVLTNVSSAIQLYIRLGIAGDPGFSDPAAQAACEYTSIFFQPALATFTWYVACFSNEVLLFKGRRLLLANTCALVAFVLAFVVGLATGLAWTNDYPVGGKREPSVWLMGANGIYLVLVVIPSVIASVRAARKATGRVNKYGMWLIMLFFVLVLMIIVWQALFTLTGDYTFSFASWLFVPAGILSAYLGLIMPPFLRRKLGEPVDLKKG